MKTQQHSLTKQVRTLSHMKGYCVKTQHNTSSLVNVLLKGCDVQSNINTMTTNEFQSLAQRRKQSLFMKSPDSATDSGSLVFHGVLCLSSQINCQL